MRVSPLRRISYRIVGNRRAVIAREHIAPRTGRVIVVVKVLASRRQRSGGIRILVPHGNIARVVVVILPRLVRIRVVLAH